MLRIGELATKTGVSPRLLRYYEERGLLRPQRSPSGQRLFQSDDVGRVGQIRDLLDAGLGTERISDLLPCFDAPPDERTDYLVESLRAERAELGGRMSALQRAADALDDLIAEHAAGP